MRRIPGHGHRRSLQMRSVGRWRALAGALGKQVTATGVGIGRIADGRIVETWAEYDALGLLQQLGVIPTPQSAPSPGA